MPPIVFLTFFPSLIQTLHGMAPEFHPPSTNIPACLTGSLGERVKSAGRCMGWRIATCGAQPAAGRRPARGSSTEPARGHDAQATPASPSAAGIGKSFSLRTTLEAQGKPFQEPWWNYSRKTKQENHHLHCCC